MFCALQCNAQILLRSSTFVGGSVSLNSDSSNNNLLNYLSFEQTVHWKRRFNKFKREKMLSNFYSLYKRNNMLGARIYGFELDPLISGFESTKGSTFKLWNKIRIGFSFNVEGELDSPELPWDEYFGYLDGELYFRYSHLPRSARGDKRTKYRKGSIDALFLITANERADCYFKIKPIGCAWLKAYYKKERHIQHLGICAEIEVRNDGYGGIKFGSSKDLYRGFTFIGGPEYNMKTKQVSFNLGVKFDARNY
jgi:hypothetical protein